MNNEAIDLAPFLGEIEEVINQISHDTLKSNVIAYAKDLPPAKRFEFLQIIALDDESFDDITPAEYNTDKELLEDARQFYANILKGAYDHSLDINNPDDVPAWVDDMDILFDRADEAFMFNDRAYAAEVYEILLDSLHIAEDIAVEHQLYSAQDMVISDITEEKARYFRSLFESSEAAVRAEKLFAAMKQNYALGEARSGLVDMLESDGNELEGYKEFLGEWLNLLKAEDADESDFDKRIRLWLLCEAAFAQNSFKGLEDLAKDKTTSHPEVYYDLVAYYVKANELHLAEEAARHGIDQIERIHQKAVLADWLAELAAKDGDKELALKTRKEAWRYEPTQERLVNWCNSNGGVISDDELKEEVAFLRKHSESNKFVRLVCMLELLIGEYDLPVKALIAADHLGWRPESHPGQVVLPFLLLAGSGIRDIPENSALKSVTDEMKSIFIRWQAHLIHGKQEQELHSYLDYLYPALEKHSISEEQMDIFLATARTVILDRIRVVVTENLEHLFPHLARKAVAYAEVCYLSGNEERGMKLIENIRNMYIRQNVLRSEIRRQFNNSSVLPHLTPQGKLANSN